MKEITKEEYIKASEIVSVYEEQEKKKKHSMYLDCNEEDIISNKCKHYDNDVYEFWVTKETKIPKRKPDAILIDNKNYWSMLGSKLKFNDYDTAHNHMIKTFKRKKYI